MQNTFTPNFNIITIKEFANLIKKPPSTVYSWRANGNIPERCFKIIGKTIFVKISEMELFINNCFEEEQ